MKLTPEQVGALGYKAGWRGSALVIAIAVAGAESGYETAPGSGNPPHSSTDDYGLWQINHPAHPQYDTAQLVADPLYNARAAYAISSGGTSWRPWTTFRTGAYRAHLAEAQAAVDGIATKALTASGTFNAGVGGTTSATVPGNGGILGVVEGIISGIIPGAIGGIVPGAGAAAGAVGGLAGDVAGAVLDGIKGMFNIPGLGTLTHLLEQLASGQMWRRLGLILAGSVLVYLGAMWLVSDLAGGPAKVAESVAEAAKAP